MELLSRKKHPDDLQDITFPGGIVLTASHCVMMAGPCAAETRDQVMRSAEFLAGLGVRVFRAG